MSSQRMTVPVEVPEMKVVHVARVHLLHDGEVLHKHSVNGAQGCPIPAEVCIEHTRQWSQEADDEALNFYYEVQASPESWLVGGQCRARFSAKVSLVCPTAFTVLIQVIGRRKAFFCDLAPSSEARTSPATHHPHSTSFTQTTQRRERRHNGADRRIVQLRD